MESAGPYFICLFPASRCGGGSDKRMRLLAASTFGRAAKDTGSRATHWITCYATCGFWLRCLTGSQTAACRLRRLALFDLPLRLGHERRRWHSNCCRPRLVLLRASLLHGRGTRMFLFYWGHGGTITQAASLRGYGRACSCMMVFLLLLLVLTLGSPRDHVGAVHACETSLTRLTAAGEHCADPFDS